MQAAESLNYVVNAHAKALSGQVPGAIALIMREVAGPSLNLVAAGAEQEAAARGRLTLVAATQGHTERERDLVRLMREQNAAAVILVGGAMLDEEYDGRMVEYATSLHAAGSRLVLCGRPLRSDGLPATVVEYDNTGGAFQVVDQLLAAGHRRILHLGGPLLGSSAQERRVGYRRALRAHGVPYDEELDVPGTFHRASGHERIREAISAGLKFTAVFASTDMVALGALAGLREAGLEVPDDVSLVGFDDVLFAAELSPALTTVRVPYEELGRTAVRLALAHQEGTVGDDRMVLGAQLVVRQSVRPRVAPPAPGGEGRDRT